jgi:hypothetical protein
MRAKPLKSHYIQCLLGQGTVQIRTISRRHYNNKLSDNEKGTCMLIDVAVSEERNVIKREAKKFLKYTDLTKEI